MSNGTFDGVAYMLKQDKIFKKSTLITIVMLLCIVCTIVFSYRDFKIQRDLGNYQKDVLNVSLLLNGYYGSVIQSATNDLVVNEAGDSMDHQLLSNIKNLEYILIELGRKHFQWL